jgi:hypothetical protein
MELSFSGDLISPSGHMKPIDCDPEAEKKGGRDRTPDLYRVKPA